MRQTAEMEKPVARDWYVAERMADGVTLIREKHVAPWLRCNIWHVRGRDRDLVIDTGLGLRSLVDEVPALAGRPLLGVATHTHFDHSGGLHHFADRAGHRLEADIIAAPDMSNTMIDTGFWTAESLTALPFRGFDYRRYRVRPAPLTELLDDGDRIDLGDRSFRVLHLPGHSPGSIALYEDATGALFSGDVVYDGDLIDNLSHSDPETLKASMARLRELPVTVVHGGHFASFGRDKLLAIMDEYLAGGRRLGDADAWVSRAQNTAG
jgi:glyoxylase-like metal-dependent hydrolase (beta-lactamase superfamily II)